MSTQIITVNGKEITIASFDNKKYVAIKPICEAIGVNYETQLDKIKNDEILSELLELRKMISKDGKRYKMRVIPLKYVFGWLFTINPKKVKPEIKQDVLKYRMDFYNAFLKQTNLI